MEIGLPIRPEIGLVISGGVDVVVVSGIVKRVAEDEERHVSFRQPEVAGADECRRRTNDNWQ